MKLINYFALGTLLHTGCAEDCAHGKKTNEKKTWQWSTSWGDSTMQIGGVIIDCHEFAANKTL